MSAAGWQAAYPEVTLQLRLEKGDIVPFIPCPFPLLQPDEAKFLTEQRVGGIGHKNISYNPHTDAVTGHERRSRDQSENLRRLLRQFSTAAATWVAGLLPSYAQDWRLDRVSLRTEEEATRRVRLTARNDLLHVDAFPSRPTQGDRILRLFVNIHPSEPRVWVTSDSFATLVDRFGSALGLSTESVGHRALRFGRQFVNLFRGHNVRTDYDRFMLRLHHFLKGNEDFQERARRRFWHFSPGTAWLAFTDGFCHAELRGRYAIEHSFFVSRRALLHPELAPATLLEHSREKNRAA